MPSDPQADWTVEVTMYAIIEDGGRQIKVEEGQEIDVDYRDAPRGGELTFDRVLACRDDNGFKVGQPTLTSATVVAEVLGPSQGPKITVQKIRRRKTYRRKTGHRQLYTRVRIQKIEV
jgi:large subunit ribosomal protein L21